MSNDDGGVMQLTFQEEEQQQEQHEQQEQQENLLSLDDIVRGDHVAVPLAPLAPLGPPLAQLEQLAPKRQVVTLANTDDLDNDFLTSLSNPRKTKKRGVKKGDILHANEELDMYSEEASIEAANLERIHRLRIESQQQNNDDELMAPLNLGNAVVYEQEVSSNSDPLGFAFTDYKRPPPKTPRKSRSSKKSVVVASDEERQERDEHYSRDEQERPRRRSRKSKAELFAEERKHKSQRVARIQQLQAKAIACTLDKKIDWMSLPLAYLDDELAVMETKYNRTKKIQKMRAGFFALNKGLAWGLSSHPGPEYLRFPAIKGLEETIKAELDEFDDPLEKLWDSWFGSSGEIHPLMEIMLLEAVIIGNHVMRKDETKKAGPDNGGIKTVVDGVRQDGQPMGSGATSSTNLFAGLSSMVSNNPNLADAVKNMMQAQGAAQAPQAQQQQAAAQRHTFGDYGPPPGYGPSPSYGPPPGASNEHDIEFVNSGRAMNKEWQQQQQAMAANAAIAAAAASAAAYGANYHHDGTSEELRHMIDAVVDRHAGGRSSRVEEVFEDDDDILDPVHVEMPPPKTTKRR